MRPKRNVFEEKESNFNTVINESGYKIPYTEQVMNEKGERNDFYGFKTPEPIDPEDCASNYTIATSMDAGIDPSTRNPAPKVYGLGTNPEELQRQIEQRTKDLDYDLVMQQFEKLKAEKKAQQKGTKGTGATTTEEVTEK